MKKLLAVILLAASSCFGAAEILSGHVRGIGASTFTGLINSGQMSFQACDKGNTSTAVAAWIAIDDSTFAAHATVSGLTCSAPNALYDATQVIGSVNPQDGAQHSYYVKIRSNTTPGSGDFLLVGGGYPSANASGIDQGYPYKFTGGAVAPMYVPSVMTNGQRLTAAHFGVITNSNDPYSVGTNSGGATRLCLAATCGADLWSNGVAAYWANAHGVPFASANFCDAALPIQQNIASPSATGPLDTCRAKFAAGGVVQAIAFAAAEPSIVTGSTYNMTLTGYLSVGNFPSALTGTNYFCPTSGQALGFSQVNPFFNKISSTPFTNTGLFQVTMLAGELNQNGSDTFTGPWVEDAATFKTIVDAAVAAQDTNPSNGVVYSMFGDPTGTNAARQSQAEITPVTATLTNATYTRLGTNGSPITSTTLTSTNALIFSHAFATVGFSSTLSFVPGAGLWWAITSTSGVLPYDANQTPVTWSLGKGAVMAYGEALEPCGAIGLKNPDPILVQGLYQQGATASQAIYGAVKVSYFGANIAGDPLAAPFTQPALITGGTVFLGVTTSIGVNTVH